MKIRKTIGGVVLGLGLIGTAALATAASSSGEIAITVAPPPDRVEIAPEPRAGFIYERGHYEWDGHEYVWREGRFFEKREGHVWTPYALEHRGDMWYYRRGHWDDQG